MTQETSSFSALAGQQYMNLTSFRKSGEGVKTPVWFAEKDGKLYVLTLGNAGKVKRIRNNSLVQVGPSDARGKSLGPEASAHARILAPAEHQIAIDLLNKKYGLIKRLFDLFGMVSGSLRTREYIEIKP
jgi:uncharacterized protein